VAGAELLGVLFDWRGTHVCDPEEDVWLRAAAAQLGRELDTMDIAILKSGLEAAAEEEGLSRRLLRADCSADDRSRVGSIARTL